MNTWILVWGGFNGPFLFDTQAATTPEEAVQLNDKVPKDTDVLVFNLNAGINIRWDRVANRRPPRPRP